MKHSSSEAELSPARKILKVFHPEGIPHFGTAFYNALSLTGTFQGFYQLIARDILNYCSSGSILDIGTGPGWLPVKLHQLCPGLQITGVDISPSMVARAQKNIAKAGFSGQISIKKNEADHLPFTDNSFDAVVSTGSIHHWKKPTEILNEAYRILKPNSFALMYDIVSDTPASAQEDTTHQFGRLKSKLIFLHALEEPFYSYSNFQLLARPTLFSQVDAHFVGPMCCLVLKKTPDSQPYTGT